MFSRRRRTVSSERGGSGVWRLVCVVCARGMCTEAASRVVTRGGRDLRETAPRRVKLLDVHEWHRALKLKTIDTWRPRGFTQVVEYIYVQLLRTSRARRPRPRLPRPPPVLPPCGSE
eukprot:3477278-Prymnesium_polylepis.2